MLILKPRPLDAATACDSEPDWRCYCMPTAHVQRSTPVLSCNLPYTPPLPVFDPSSPIHRFRSVQHPLKICSGFRVTAPLPPPSVTNPAPFIQAWREAIQTCGLLRAPSIHARGTAAEIKQVAPAPPALCRFLPFLPSSKSILQIPLLPSLYYNHLSLQHSQKDNRLQLLF